MHCYMTEKIILVNKNNIPTLKKDHIVINKIEIKEKDNIVIKVLFHGGCKEHLFRLFGFFEDNRILNLLLEHDSNGDNCKMIVRKDLIFDLLTVKNDFTMRNIRNNFLMLKLGNLEAKYHIV